MKNAEFSDDIKSMKSEEEAVEADPAQAVNGLDYVRWNALFIFRGF